MSDFSNAYSVKQHRSADQQSRYRFVKLNMVNRSRARSDHIMEPVHETEDRTDFR